jgi:hypothetical protein
MALSDYLSGRYATIYSVLGWSDSYAAIIEDALELYGADTESEATDLTKLHRLADYALWKQARATVSLDYDYSGDGASDKRSQMAAQVKENLRLAYVDALAYIPGLQIEATRTNTRKSVTLRATYENPNDCRTITEESGRAQRITRHLRPADIFGFF